MSEIDAFDFYETVVGASEEEKPNEEKLTKEKPTKPELSPYDNFRQRCGCKLVFSDETRRYVMVLPNAVPKPKGFRLGSKLYQKRCEEEANITFPTLPEKVRG